MEGTSFADSMGTRYIEAFGLHRRFIVRFVERKRIARLVFQAPALVSWIAVIPFPAGSQALISFLAVIVADLHAAQRGIAVQASVARGIGRGIGRGIWHGIRDLRIHPKASVIHVTHGRTEASVVAAVRGAILIVIDAVSTKGLGRL